jgi:hypothetical protein
MKAATLVFKDVLFGLKKWYFHPSFETEENINICGTMHIYLFIFPACCGICCGICRI